jgi:hypothetical protein
VLSDDDDGIVVEALSSVGSEVASDCRRPRLRVRDWRIIAGDSREHLVRLALISVPFVSLRVGYEKLVGDGDRSTSHNIEEQASGLEPDRMQRSVKFSKDFDDWRDEI